ncbi:hypothetical protein ACQR3R_13740 [Gordonia sp. IEGM753]
MYRKPPDPRQPRPRRRPETFVHDPVGNLLLQDRVGKPIVKDNRLPTAKARARPARFTTNWITSAHRRN